MKLASAMVSAIPDTTSIGYLGSNLRTFYIPEEKEPQFEKLAQALRAKSLVYIENIGAQLPSFDSLLQSRIRDFSPSDGYEYVAISTEEYKKYIDLYQIKAHDKNSNFGLFHIALFDTKINVPELNVISASENSKGTLGAEAKKNYRIQVPNNSKDVIFSFLKLGYKEIPIKLSKKSLKYLEKLSKETGLNLISRKINVLPLEK